MYIPCERGPINLRFPRVTRIRKDKGPEGCIDTTELEAVKALLRIPATAGGHRRSSTQGGHDGSGSRRDGGGGQGRGKGRRGGGAGRQVSELFAMAEGTVAVKEKVFVVARDSEKPLEMCVMGDRFYSEVTNGCARAELICKTLCFGGGKGGGGEGLRVCTC